MYAPETDCPLAGWQCQTRLNTTTQVVSGCCKPRYKANGQTAEPPCPTAASYHDHISGLLQTLHWLPVIKGIKSRLLPQGHARSSLDFVHPSHDHLLCPYSRATALPASPPALAPSPHPELSPHVPVSRSPSTQPPSITPACSNVLVALRTWATAVILLASFCAYFLSSSSSLPVCLTALGP